MKEIGECAERKGIVICKGAMYNSYIVMCLTFSFLLFLVNEYHRGLPVFLWIKTRMVNVGIQSIS